MERSEEICRVVHRWLGAMRECGADTAIGKISEHPGVLGIGSDAEEWWHREDAAVWRQQIDEAGGFPFTWDEIEGRLGGSDRGLGGREGHAPVQRR